MITLQAEKEKVFTAEKQIAYIRALVILLGTCTYFFLDPQIIQKGLSLVLLFIIWTYGAFVLLFKPYERYPVFLTAWFTFTGDAVLATLWLYATGGFHSPYYVMYYTSIVAVAFRFDFKTTVFTSCLYAFCYIVLLSFMNQLANNTNLVVVRTGFILILGLLAELISRETLEQTKGKITMEKLANEARSAREELEANHEKLDQLNAELTRSNLDLQQFTSIASHDLRAPLRKIHLFVERMEIPEGENKKLQEKIKKSVNEMNALMTDLLEYAKVNTGTDIPFKPVDLTAIVKGIMEDLKGAYPERLVKFNSERLPVIPGLPSQIHQLFQNLLGNAYKFVHPDKTHEINITCTIVSGSDALSKESLAKGRDFYKITVRDNGIGFDQQYQAKIFSIFQRLHSKEEFEGTGIGLAICKKVVELHHGYITAEGQPGLGASFFIYLPLADLI